MSMLRPILQAVALSFRFFLLSFGVEPAAPVVVDHGDPVPDCEGEYKFQNTSAISFQQEDRHAIMEFFLDPVCLQGVEGSSLSRFSAWALYYQTRYLHGLRL